MTRIKGIIFDYGGIFSNKAMLHEFAEYYAPKKEVDAEKFGKVMYENWQKAKVNEIDSSLFWKNIGSEMGIDADKFREDFVFWFGFDEEMKGFAEKLKKTYKIGLLSNQIEDWLEELLDHHGLRELFDVVVTSYGEKVAKPDPLIYQRAIEKMGLPAEQMVFIDDLERNLGPAQDAGLNVIHYTGMEELKKKLKEYGVEITQ